MSVQRAQAIKDSCTSDEEDEQVEEYERLRNARLAENRKRMAELGLLRLSASLSQAVRRHPINAGHSSSLGKSSRPVRPSRRSLRLEGGPRKSYREHQRQRMGRLVRDSNGAGRGVLQPEIYSVLDEKLLGSCNNEWQLLKDGDNDDGDRVVDPSNRHAKICHQCRLRGIGHYTWCNFCEDPQGQLCGDCLYKRYGEHVLEALADKYWTCPRCRGLCNCSSCRRAKGWKPIGNIYKQVIRLGYKSVAHFLVLTRRSLPPEKIPSALQNRKEINKPQPKLRDVSSSIRSGGKMDVPSDSPLTMYRALVDVPSVGLNQETNAPDLSRALITIQDEEPDDPPRLPVMRSEPEHEVAIKERNVKGTLQTLATGTPALGSCPTQIRKQETDSNLLLSPTKGFAVEIKAPKQERVVLSRLRRTPTRRSLTPKTPQPQAINSGAGRRRRSLKEDNSLAAGSQALRFLTSRRPKTRSMRQSDAFVHSDNSDDCMMLDANPAEVGESLHK